MVLDTALGLSVMRWRTPAVHRRLSQLSSARRLSTVPLTCLARTERRPKQADRSLMQAHSIPRRTLFGEAVVFFKDHVPTVLLPPVLFVFLVVTLWVQKCIMMVLFQNKIIYMPSLPPFSRYEKLNDYARSCGRVIWEERHIRSLDGTRIALALGRMQNVSNPPTAHTVIVYFQGNGSSLPPRTPMLSKILIAVTQANPAAEFTLVALSYRGYWTSSGRPSQWGIEMDAQAVLRWIQEEYGTSVTLMLWGQSIGAGVAAKAAASYLARDHIARPSIAGLLLENPFTSIKSMLAALYPERWVPYKYLWPFLRNWWDTEAAFRTIADAKLRPRILLVASGKDEVVPAAEADRLNKLSEELGLGAQRIDVVGALHNEASTKHAGRLAIVAFIGRQG